MKCAILTTDTKHHRYFANKLSKKAQTTVVLEHRTLTHWKLYWMWVRRHKSIWSLGDNPYIRLGYSRFQRLQDEFEERFFATGLPREFSGYSAMHEFYSVNDSECVELVRELQPDLIVSFGTGLIRQGILQVDALKINIHRGILPKYRGLDSDLWAFYFRDFDNVGTTVHKLEARFDTGDIVRQEKLQIEPGMKVYQMRYYTTLLATEMVESIIEGIRQGNAIVGEPQDLSQGEYYSHIPPLKRLLAIWRFNKCVKGLA